MHLILILWLALAGVSDAWGAPTLIRSPGSIAVRKGPGDGYLQIFFLTKGEKVAVDGAEGDFSKVRVKREGKIYGGYVRSRELYGKVEVPEFDDEAWAIGLGALFSDLSQKGKSFQTEDEVTYTTSKYGSRLTSPLLWVQVSRTEAWRFFLGYRRVRFTGSASNDVSPTLSQSVQVDYKMFSFGIQRLWNPLKAYRPFYFGAGAEAARATAMTIILNGKSLPTTAEDLPLYIGLHAMAGLQFNHGKKFSTSWELRGGQMINQSILALEAGATAFYWF